MAKFKGNGNATVGLGGTQGTGVERLKNALKNRIVKKGITKSSQGPTKAMKASAPVRNSKDIQGGTLKRSWGLRVTVNRRTNVVSGVIGVRRGFKWQVAQKPPEQYGLFKRLLHKAGLIRPPRDGKVYVDPAKYFHLVEYGTYRSRARPFVRTVWGGMRQQSVGVFVATVREEVRKQAVKGK